MDSIDLYQIGNTIIFKGKITQTKNPRRIGGLRPKKTTFFSFL